MKRLIVPLLWFSVLAFIAIAVYFIGWPTDAAASIGVEMTDATARTDIRATYGGMCLGAGLFWLWCLGYFGQGTVQLAAGTWSMLFLYGGLGVIRGLSIVQGERPNGWMWSFLVIELVVTGICIAAARDLKKPDA